MLSWATKIYAIKIIRGKNSNDFFPTIKQLTIAIFYICHMVTILNELQNVSGVTMAQITYEEQTV